MNWLRILQIALPLIINWLNNLEDDGDCPDGSCDEIRDELVGLQAQVEQPRNLNATGSTLDFLSCVDSDRLFDAAKALTSAIKAKDYSGAFSAGVVIVQVIRNAINGICPDDSKKVG